MFVNKYFTYLESKYNVPPVHYFYKEDLISRFSYSVLLTQQTCSTDR